MLIEHKNISTDEVQHAISLSKPKIIFVAHEHQKLFRNLQKSNAFIKKVIAFGDEFKHFVQQCKGANTTNFQSDAQNIDDNVALILCSSGTTGLPKGVQLTQKNLMIGIEQHAYDIY